MAVVETQAYLDEAKSFRALGDLDPLVANLVGTQQAVCTLPWVRQGLKGFVNRGGDAAQEAQRLQKLLQDSAMAEPDAALRGKYEAQFQAVGAMLRTLGEIHRHLRELQQAARQFEGTDDEIRNAAVLLGYTV